MAKEEKPLEYQKRIRDTKGVAQRLDLNYLRRPAFLARVRRGLIWGSVAAAAILGLGTSRRGVMNGNVSAAHASIEDKCQSCHTIAFAKVPDKACETCHNVGVHHLNAVQPPPPCSQCHIEHEGTSHQLAKVASGNCATCHANNPKMKPASDFRPGKHPEFSTATMVDTRPIKLNHAIHMPAAPKTIRNIKLPMKCADCHTMDKPTTFEANCKSCHARELEFDVRHVLGPNAPPAPHTRDPLTIRAFIMAAYQGMPNSATLVRESEDYLFQRKCVYCHEGGAPQAVPNPTGITRKWFTRSEFEHKAHRAVKCEDCHDRARASTKTSDVLIPKMEKCLSCHGDARAELDRCSVCHLYHKPDLEKPR